MYLKNLSFFLIKHQKRSKEIKLIAAILLKVKKFNWKFQEHCLTVNSFTFITLHSYFNRLTARTSPLLST